MRFILTIALALFIPIQVFAQPLDDEQMQDVYKQLRPLLIKCLHDETDYNGGSNADVYSDAVQTCNQKLIDKSPELQKLQGGSTGMMAQSFVVLGHLWQEQLDEKYSKTLICLKNYPKLLESLKTSQAAWMGYKKTQVEWISSGGGDLSYIRAPLWNAWLIANRTLEMTDESKGECK